ncbi:MAG: hypothetical protein V1733_07210 [bacterium]
MRIRPLVLSALCIFSWIYFGLMALLFLTAALYNGWITEIVHQYLPESALSEGVTLGLFLTGFLLHATSFAGVIFLWKLRKIGYVLFSIPALLVVLVHLFRSDISWIVTALYILLVISFGIYYRRYGII